MRVLVGHVQIPRCLIEGTGACADLGGPITGGPRTSPHGRQADCTVSRLAVWRGGFSSPVMGKQCLGLKEEWWRVGDGEPPRQVDVDGDTLKGLPSLCRLEASFLARGPQLPVQSSSSASPALSPALPPSPPKECWVYWLRQEGSQSLPILRSSTSSHLLVPLPLIS